MVTKAEKIKPLSDYLLVELIEEDTTLPSGIVIPDSVKKEKPQEGKIIAVGPGKKDDSGKTIKIDIKVGDIVMFKKWGGTEIKIEGKEMLLVREEDILAIIK